MVIDIACEVTTKAYYLQLRDPGTTMPRSKKSATHLRGGGCCGSKAKEPADPADVKIVTNPANDAFKQQLSGLIGAGPPASPSKPPASPTTVAITAGAKGFGFRLEAEQDKRGRGMVRVQSVDPDSPNKHKLTTTHPTSEMSRR